ncbi:class I SAM-dependent methyltransferase [Synechococcus sp. LA31]|uniref:class I SAM-dependent methyltransferase n=1 Tax=Synechococcus sp. LA31 TaxID=2741953 RepID=UPI001BDD7FB7|nr:SAM-dependent methyltransferase [Synechococcus sp. LA31]QVV68481.1 SAM-dependent methyltransferase [Synechococcus sp. LA31]
MSSVAAPFHPAPAWLAERLREAGGAVPFRTYMQWALHDPEHGAYGSGRLQVGPRGDFATSPSLGPDFAALLAPQIAQWLEQQPADQPLVLLEAGPGEGDLALQLAQELAAGWPELAVRTTLVLIEPNAGMAERQRARLRECPLPCRWQSFAELAAQPVRGVLLAHEVLDALAVERIVWDGTLWRRQQLALHEMPDAQPLLRLEPGDPLVPQELAQLETLSLLQPGSQRPPGWCTELHPEQDPWLQAAAAALGSGVLLVIDYAHEAWRYYAPHRSNGTLMAYRQQQASPDPLQEPGYWDLTAHLCLETLEQAALATGWQPLGQRRQGEALLALGLAQRLHGLQQQRGVGLDALLARREALLRLVDPHTLGDFRWAAFARSAASGDQGLSDALFLQDPPLA